MSFAFWRMSCRIISCEEDCGRSVVLSMPEIILGGAAPKSFSKNSNRWVAICTTLTPAPPQMPMHNSKSLSVFSFYAYNLIPHRAAVPAHCRYILDILSDRCYRQTMYIKQKSIHLNSVRFYLLCSIHAELNVNDTTNSVWIVESCFARQILRYFLISRRHLYVFLCRFKPT